MRAQGSDQELLEQAGAGVEQGQDACDRKTAADGLVGRLAEGTLQAWCIGHADAGAIDEPGAVTVPKSDDVGQGLARLDEASEQGLEDG